MTGWDESYLAKCCNGRFFSNTGFILLPVNDRDDSRKHLTIQEYRISKSTPSYRDHHSYSTMTETATEKVSQLWGQNLTPKVSRSAFGGVITCYLDC